MGAYFDDTTAGTDGGSGYVFVRSGRWSQKAKLTADDPWPMDNFGCSVSLSSDGNTAALGAAGDDPVGWNSGSAYVFDRSGTNWSERIKLIAADGAELDCFGESLSLRMSSNYNTRPRAAEAMVHGDEAHLVRRRESVEDLYTGESVPPW